MSLYSETSARPSGSISEQAHLVSLIVSVDDRVGALDDCLSAFKSLNISLTRIESRPSKTRDWDYDFFLDFHASSDDEVCFCNTTRVSTLTEQLSPA